MKATNKDKAQKMISAKIVAKLVELANKYVVPCININVPGRYSASQLYDEKDALGNKLFWSIDADKCNVSQIEVTITESDFNEKELEELGYSPKFKLSIQNLMVFRAIAKYEQLAGLRSANRAKFVVGEPATIYETERAKVVIYECEADTIVTKTKKITIISDTQAVYRHDKKTIALCLKINGKWFAVHRFPIAAYDFDALVEIIWEKCNIDNMRAGVKATAANSQRYYPKFVEFCGIIQSELDSMDKLNAEAANTQAADNVVADSEGNANVATENASKAGAETACKQVNDDSEEDSSEPKSTGNNAQIEQRQINADAPPKDSGTTKNQCGRKLAVLSDFVAKVIKCTDKAVKIGNRAFIVAKMRFYRQM